MTPRRGFTMITTLWVMTVASIVALAGALAGRTAVSAARNRVQGERALWTALGCARETQSRIDDALGNTTLDEGATIWRALDRRALSGFVNPNCRVRLEAAGARMDINAATPAMIIAVLRAVGETEADAAQMADAVADWRDTDQVVSPLGAERDWYTNASRAAPRNGPFADIRELELVRGFERLSRFEPYFSTEPGRISLGHASVEVLSAVPGFTAETAQLIAQLALVGTPVTDAAAIAGRVSAHSTSEIMAHYPEIVRSTTGDPDAWILEVRAWNGNPRTTVAVVWRLIRTGRRCSVVSSRTYL